MKQTIKLFIIAFIGMSNLLNAQIPPCLWAQNAGGTSSDFGRAVATDASGNVFVAGYFNSTTITFGTSTLTNSGSNDIFIVKYSPTGTVLWASTAVGISSDLVYGAATDASGNVFITGHFDSPTLAFGTSTLLNVSGGSSDIFIVKYSPSGTVLWASSAGGVSSDLSYGISSDASGNVFVTGGFESSTITFGTNTLTNSGAGNSDVFIVKYSPSGIVLWASSVGGNTYFDTGKGVSTDINGNVFLAGTFYSPTIAFGTTTLTNASVNGSSSDIFIVKYSPTGTVLWASSKGGAGFEWAYGTSTDASGNIFVTGQFDSPSIAFGTTTLTNASTNSDIFTVKYSPSGSVIWANSGAGTDNDSGEGVSTDASGNVFVTGTFASSIIAFGTTTLTNAGFSLSATDMYMVKYSPAGALLWVSSIGSAGSERGNGVSTDASGNLFVTGSFASSTLAIGTTTLTNANGNGFSSEVFIAKFSNAVVGISKNQMEEDGIIIYPNPFTSQTTISFSKEQTNTIISIIDILGKVVMQFSNVMGTEVSIDRGSLQAGIYFIQVTDEKNKVMISKIILQ